MSFYFPRQKIYITVPYKNGATSALNFFVSVEKYLEAKGARLSELDSLENLHINQDFSVHAKTGEYSAEPFRTLATQRNMKNANIRFFIIRDPYKRFSSFWHNRIMNGPDPYFARIQSDLSSKYVLQNSSDAQKAAIDFLNNLAKPFTKPITNGHLWPQIFMTHGKRYDFIFETEELANLPRVLADNSNHFQAFRKLELPLLNVSANKEYSLLWNAEERAAFAKTYAGDLELYKNFKLGKCDSIENIQKLQKKSYSHINPYSYALILIRGFLKKIIKH